jgi:hypothetical protein
MEGRGKRVHRLSTRLKKKGGIFIQPSGCIVIKERDGLFRPFLEGVMHKQI